MGKGKGHVPVRTCISCGLKKEKNNLTRLVIDKDGKLVKDIFGRMHGRGGYVCKSSACMEKLPGNKRLNRLFRKNKTITVDIELFAME